MPSEGDDALGSAQTPGAGGWGAIGLLEDLPDGRAVRIQVDVTDVLVVRAGERIFAVGDRCTHQGAPLDRGVVRGDGPTPTVTCPAHGSVFSLEGGGVLRGPATRPVPAFEIRVRDGTVELRPLG
jgi:nitrite reductase/ring-hydroxylating ferredoxin subunit